MYPGFAKIARKEGFEQVAKAFEAVSIAEKQHGKRYTDLADNLEAGRVFKRAGKVVWRCRLPFKSHRAHPFSVGYLGDTFVVIHPPNLAIWCR